MKKNPTAMNIHNKKLTAGVALAALVIAVAVGYIVIRPGGAEPAATAATRPDSSDAASTPGGLASFDHDGDGIIYQDAMHPWYVQDEPGTAPDCGMELTPVRVDGSMEPGTVSIDAVTRQNIGVRTAEVTVESLGSEIRTTGRFVMDEQGERGITLKVDGYIEKLYADFNGMRIQKGQRLLELYSPDLVTTQEEYLLALRNAERLSGTSSSEDAQRLVDAALRRLQYWDLADEQIQRLQESGTPQRTVTFYAPSSGEVMNKRVSEGDFVRAGEELMQVVDISRIWLIADVYEKDLARVKVGTTAQIELPYSPGIVFQGKVDHVYHMLDMDLRAAKARIVLPGAHAGHMKPGMYATVRLTGDPVPASPVVPSESLVRTGDEEVVILALGDGRFRPVKVVSGIEVGGRVQILSGLDGGETIVTSAQFLIDSEARLQSAVGALTAGGLHDHGGGGQTGGSSPEVEDRREAVPHPPVEDQRGAVPHSAVDEPQGTASHPAAPTGSHDQSVPITVGTAGFAPDRIELKAGIPTRLVFTRTTDETCATEIQVPGFDIGPTSLPLNEPTSIEITPPADGSATFACGMDMVTGTIIVTS